MFINKKITATVLALIIAFGMCSCSKSSEPERPDRHNSERSGAGNQIVSMETSAAMGDCYEESEMDFGSNAIASDSYSTDNVNVTYNNRMLIRRVTMEVDTLEYDSVYSTVRAQVIALGGYIEWSDIQGSGEEGSLRHGSFVIRVPSNVLDELINSFSGRCTVTSQSESTEDVTLTYSDIESHIEALRIEQETLMTLLSETTDMSNILVIQNRLTELNYEIESYTSQSRLLQDLVSYGTLTLTINEIIEDIEPTPTPVVEKTFREEVNESFKTSLEDLNESFKEFVIALAAGLPYILIFLTVAIIVVVIIMVSVSKKRKNKKTTPPTPSDT